MSRSTLWSSIPEKAIDPVTRIYLKCHWQLFRNFYYTDGALWWNCLLVVERRAVRLLSKCFFLSNTASAFATLSQTLGRILTVEPPILNSNAPKVLWCRLKSSKVDLLSGSTQDSGFGSSLKVLASPPLRRAKSLVSELIQAPKCVGSPPYADP